MPIRLECPRCHDVTHFADNDAGLAVACLACGQHLRIPKPAPAATQTVSASPQSLEPPPLFATTPAHLLVAAPAASPPKPAAPPPALQVPHHRPIRPARPITRWRSFIFFILLSCTLGVTTILYVKRTLHGTTNAANNPTTVIPTTSQPTSSPTDTPARRPTEVASRFRMPPPEVVPQQQSTAAPILVSAVSTSKTRHYTPPTAPLGFIGFERIDLTGHLQIDSYDADAGPYNTDTARAAAPLLSNGPIQLTCEGALHGQIHSADALPIKIPKRLQVTGSTDPLPIRLPAPPVTLDPYAQDSNNAALPREFYKAGNLTLWGAHQLTLPAGVYYLNDVNIDSPATLRLQGPVTLLIAGRLTIAGNIETPSNRPAHCRIRITGDKPVTITQKNTLYIDLYAPQSPVEITGQGDLHGSIVARTLRITGARPMHFDESLLLPSP
jgi:hypothetical protein